MTAIQSASQTFVRASAAPTEASVDAIDSSLRLSPHMFYQPVIDITVAIPTYNGAQRLPLILERLKTQTGVEGIRWEVIVCDNNSLDSTADVVRTYQAQWDSDICPLRYGFAAEQGAAHARQHAVELAKGSLVAFLDDDNLPATDWVQQAYQFGQRYPKAGAFGSQIHGKFEGPVPQDFQKMACYLAIIERGDRPHQYDPKNKILPPGAGLVVRRQAWLDSVPQRLFLNNKGKAAGLASEDLEAVLHVQRAGWEIWYNADMVVEHLIPNSRLQVDYLKTLLRCVGLSRFYVRMLGVEKWKRPFLVPAYIANDIRRLALHYVKHGASADNNWIEDCQREYLTSSLNSPFFLLKKCYRDRVAQSKAQHIPDQEQWLSRLTSGFEQDQFQLHQQSVIALNNEAHLAQQEILVRLEGTPPVSPRQFMPVIEHHNLGRTLDRWVLRQFFRAYAQGGSSPMDNSDGKAVVEPYSFNLSRASICDRHFAAFVDHCLSRSSLAPHQLCFEVSESIAIDELDSVTRLAYQLQDIGCQLIIDDFGQAQNGVNLASQFPLSALKLNSHLIQSPGRKADLKKVQELVAVGQALKVLTVAKGVENRAILTHVKSLGISHAQGYELHKPRPMTRIYQEHQP